MRNQLIDKAASTCGGLSALARQLGVKPPTVHQWLTGERPVPALQCRAIEAATSGSVTAAELRPDVFGPPAQAQAAQQ